MSQLTMFKEKKISGEERRFTSYVNELKEHGWISDYVFQPKSFNVFEGKTAHIYDTDGNIVYIKLLSSQEYTPDFKLHWNNKAEGVFFWRGGGVYNPHIYPYTKKYKDFHVPFYAHVEDGVFVSYIDTKGSFVGSKNNSGHTFPKNQALVMLTNDLFVQKVVVSLDKDGIFFKTFTPRSVIIEEVYKKDYVRNGELIGKGGASKLKYEPILIEKFVNRLTQ